jgi:hypothetical protein
MTTLELAVLVWLGSLGAGLLGALDWARRRLWAAADAPRELPLSAERTE